MRVSCARIEEVIDDVVRIVEMAMFDVDASHLVVEPRGEFDALIEGFAIDVGGELGGDVVEIAAESFLEFGPIELAVVVAGDEDELIAIIDELAEGDEG